MKRTAYKRTVVAGALLLGLGLPTAGVVQRRDGLAEAGRPVEPLLDASVLLEVPGATRLSTVARAIKVDADEVEELNPHLVRKMTPPGRLMEVRIPAGRALRVALHRAL
jgi:hypothetical protein